MRLPDERTRVFALSNEIQFVNRPLGGSLTHTSTSSGSDSTITSYTSTGIAHDRNGPRGSTPIVLLHAGIANRRMWAQLQTSLMIDHDVIRLDLRGFGESTTRPHGQLSHVGDGLDTLDLLEIQHTHLVGASLGAGVAAEVALTRPELVDSLLLSAPGGSLIAELTPHLRTFIDAESSALDQGDLDGAVDANLAWWVDGPDRGPAEVSPDVRDLVRRMQRRAFEVSADWHDVQESELDPPVLDRLPELSMPTMVLNGALDLDAIHDAADRVCGRVPGARRIDWADTAHLPSMERPEDFHSLVREWVART